VVGDDDDSGPWTFILDHSGGSKPIQLGHAHVHQRQVWPKALRQGHRLIAVPRLAHDLESSLRGQHGAQTRAGQLMVVRY
jgi:hypothetical protein